MVDIARQIELEQESQSATVSPPRKPFDWGRAIMYVILVVGALVAMAPFLWMVSWSLMTSGEVALGRVIPNTVHFENYSEAWNEAKFAKFMWNSVRISAISISGLMIFSIPAAYAFARMKFTGRNALFGLMIATLMIPDIVTLIPNFLTVTWLSRFGDTVCGSACQWLNNWPSLTIPFMASAFGIFLLRQFFAQIPDELWDAARIDGAGHLRFLLAVVIPLSKAPIMVMGMFAFIASWNSLQWPLLVVQSDDWRPVAFGLTKFVQDDAPGDFHLQMAASVLMVIPLLVIYFFTQKQFTSGIASTGLKG